MNPGSHGAGSGPGDTPWWAPAQRVGAGLALLGGSWLALKFPALQRADVRVGDVARRGGTAEIDRVVARTTDLGSVYAVFGIAAALLATGRRRAAADALGLGSIAWNAAQLSKTRVRRQRPYEAEGTRRLVHPPTGSSFPSGHAAVGVAVMSALAARARGPLSRRLLASLGAYVAFSRVYAGVHYPTDVLGGAGLGLAASGLWSGPASKLADWGLALGLGVMGRVAPVVGRALLWALFGVPRARRRG